MANAEILLLSKWRTKYLNAMFIYISYPFLDQIARYSWDILFFHHFFK
nr:MAG TPA: hypothetical protein [Caudoviricetes sp.]